MISFRQKGDFSKLDNYMNRLLNPIKMDTLHRYGRKGVAALSSATPKDTGLTSQSWYYEIKQTEGRSTITFDNSNVQPGYWGGHQGVPIAIVIQYGHATRNGGWVEGIDYINPAIRPIFNELADSIWEEVTK